MTIDKHKTRQNTPNGSIIYPRHWKVIWSKSVDKQLDRIPDYIRKKFLAWAKVIERVGLEQVRKLSGYHDESLQGVRKGQRSVRLNRAYRVIYRKMWMA